ncbi:RICIN domain-containing protein [Streptomyces netropsis]|uniref:Ricin B lectin domain-containing protein n=1 Tax=Streptomyces netropsis TaxID=55404 RepID=A0A7W7PF88_STRNE|nr:ricin-type beta-trefoil lectin domain protein [Streptomyces netropsis]MBB4887462.1 hypothetical protein [Streptomyces netropsis]GGR10503.1 hypothetical protein GCM10010219_13990 [Streptomyces netropsis]
MGACSTACPPALTNQCNGGFAQRWDLEFNGTEAVRIRLPKGRCLSSLLDRRGHGKPLMFDCGTSSLQRWRLLSFGNEQYQIRGRMLVGEPRGLGGTRVCAHPHRTKPTSNEEKWIPEWVGAERLRMRDAATGLCIETDANVPNDGLLGLDLRACHGSRAQTWHVEPAAESTFRLRSDQRVLGTEPCLDLDQLAANTGSDIVNVNQCERGRASQRWFFASFDASAGPDVTGE